ncbi:4303_t:CDS:1, partial [Scutellospora calospora]
CKANLASTYQSLYSYNKRGKNTTNLINYLRNKYRITKENYLGFLDKYNE